MTKGILVTSPDIRPSLVNLLAGIHENGCFKRLVTTLAFAAAQPDRKKRYIPALMRRRSIPGWLASRTDRIWARELVRTAASRYANADSAHRVWKWAERGFDNAVAGKYAGKFEYVYGMEHSATKTFAAQHKKGGKCILRQVNAHIIKTADALKSESRRYDRQLSSYQRRVLADIPEMIRGRLEQIQYADLIVGNSKHVYDSFLAAGKTADLVYIPTGCPNLAATRARSGRHRGKLRFLYVGTLSLRKGAMRLAEIWKDSDFYKRGELYFAGAIELPKAVFSDAGAGITYCGVLTRDRLQELYRDSDVFVLPTLSEGRAHSVLEALTSGLPVITTVESGCEDLLLDHQNGRLIKAGDDHSLRDAILWHMDNRDKLPAMGLCSRELASRWTVPKANTMHSEIIKHYIDTGNTENWQDLLSH